VQTEYQATATEVNRWREIAEAYERQLSEAFKVRDELEQECRRLYLIETRVQSQEHLDQEVEQLKEMLAELEQNSDQFYLQVLLTSEVGAMAKIVQHLESQHARAQEENAGLKKSLEELDDKHQDAIGL
jgi:phosphoglycerate-specific signal transduction histidine kinase